VTLERIYALTMNIRNAMRQRGISLLRLGRVDID